VHGALGITAPLLLYQNQVPMLQCYHASGAANVNAPNIKGDGSINTANVNTSWKGS